jgi:hypothetical protein
VNHRQRGHALAALDERDVGTVQARLVGQALLADAGLKATTADRCSEALL